MRLFKRLNKISCAGLLTAGLLIGCGSNSDKDGTLILKSSPFLAIQGRTDVAAVLTIGGKICPLSVDADLTLGGQCPDLPFGTQSYILEYTAGGVVIAQASGAVTIVKGHTAEADVPSLDTSMDDDGDGYTNLDEVIAGTDPKDPRSHPARLTVTKSGVGTGRVAGPGIDCGTDCSELYQSSASVTLTAAPDTGFAFAGWSGDCAGTGLSTTMTMNADKSCTAAFNVPWAISTIDSAGDVGQYATIALDSTNKVHIAYYDAATNSDLKYITNASGPWVPSTVDSAGDVGQYASIAVDAAGVHIGYYDVTNTALKYATSPDGVSWVSTIVDNPRDEDVGQYASIAVDAAGVHIGYYDVTNTALKYATSPDGVSWVSTMVDNSGFVGQFASLTVDSTGKRYIGYYDATNGDLKYAESITPVKLFNDDFETGLDPLKWTADISPTCPSPWGLTSPPSHGGSWSVTDSPTGNYSSNTDCSITMKNSVPITDLTELSFWHQYSLDVNTGFAHVEISTDGGATWPTIPAIYGKKYGKSPDWPSWTPVSIDLSSYISPSVKIRFRLIPTGAPADGWYIDDIAIKQNYTAETLDGNNPQNPDVGQYASIARDKTTNTIHISYYDVSNGTLKYATNASGSWITSTIDGTVNVNKVGQYTSIAVDSNGKVHISYYDLTNHALKYATNGSGSWATYTIDTGNVGQYTSIAVDSNRKVHIAYYDAANGDLKYATSQ
ncbi:MAG: hypothetical protein HY204_02550 [Nitrospirae bacterium]|nr:hypothetical protein [Nitrospirota bacterium]